MPTIESGVVVVVVIIGIVAGVLGFFPLWGGLQLAKRVTKTSNLSHATSLLLAVFGSSVILLGALALCIVIDRADLVPFACGEAGGLIASALVFGIRKNLRN